MLKNSSIVSTSIDVMGGTPVFTGTRVPLQTLLDYLKAGESIDDFLDGFPTVSRAQVIALLEEAGKQLVMASNNQRVSIDRSRSNRTVQRSII